MAESDPFASEELENEDLDNEEYEHDESPIREMPPHARVTGYLELITVAAILALVVLHWTDRTTELTPDHFGYLLCAGFVVGTVGVIVALVLTFSLKVPLPGRPRSKLPIATAASSVLIGVLIFNGGARLWQMIDFAGGPTRSEGRFLIEHAYVSNDNGPHYYIQLAQYFVDFEMNPDDYARAFGTVKSRRPAGYCLTAPAEQKGAALRIMYSTRRLIPPDRVWPCAPRL